MQEKQRRRTSIHALTALPLELTLLLLTPLEIHIHEFTIRFSLKIIRVSSPWHKGFFISQYITHLATMRWNGLIITTDPNK